jgi:hypothetical protein
LIEAAYKNQTIYVQFHNDTTFGTGVLTIKREPEVKIPVEDFVKLDADFIIEEITQLFEMTIVNMDLLKYEKFKSMKHRLDMQFDRSFIRHPN